MIITKLKKLSGIISVPGDKSISHRAIMLGSIANNTTEVTNFLQGADCLSSISCFKQMGIEIQNNGKTVLISGKGLNGLQAPISTLDVGNSGTTARLMSGLLCAQPFSSRIIGDESISKRPMGRIMTPLSMMGANIKSENNNNCAPLLISPSTLKGIHYNSPVASAQVKSSILLAGLYANGETSVTEPYVSRNHTELMFESFGVEYKTKDTTVTVFPASKLNAQKIYVPGDISSAAYFIVAGLITPNSSITIKDVGINPTRDGIIKVCQKMGGKIILDNVRDSLGEPIADITVETSELNGCEVSGSLIPTLIDEIPIIAIMACFAKGKTIIKDASELKVKESNRIDVMVNNLKLMGADIESTKDGMIITGGKELNGATIESHMDHRIAMSFAIAGINASGTTNITNSSCVDISYPDFYSHLSQLSK